MQDRNSGPRLLEGAPATSGGEFEPLCGDLYASPLTSPLGIEWAVLRLGASGETLFAIPADIDTRRGSRDVEVPPEAAAGPLTLRCGQGLWLAKRAFGPTLQSGRLDALHSRLALDRVRAIEESRLRPSYSEAKAEDLPAYGRWLRQGPLKARDLLAEHSLVVSAGPAAQPPAIQIPPPPLPRSLLRMAASFLLPVALGVLAALFWDSRIRSDLDPGSTDFRGPGQGPARGMQGLVDNPLDDEERLTRGSNEVPRKQKQAWAQGGFYLLTLYDRLIEADEPYVLQLSAVDSGETSSQTVSRTLESPVLFVLLDAEIFTPGLYQLVLTAEAIDNAETEPLLDLDLELMGEEESSQPNGTG